MIERIHVSSHAPDAWIDITDCVRSAVGRSGLKEGVATLYVPHTTAGIAIQENADPPLKRDISNALERLFPRDGDYGHCEDNAAAHMKAVFSGPSASVPFAAGQLLLGTWQSVYLCEFDGPRERTVVMHVA